MSIFLSPQNSDFWPKLDLKPGPKIDIFSKSEENADFKCQNIKILDTLPLETFKTKTKIK